jgi:hypothetical protein
VIVRFGDIGGIVDYRCFNFHFITIRDSTTKCTFLGGDLPKNILAWNKNGDLPFSYIHQNTQDSHQ